MSKFIITEEEYNHVKLLAKKNKNKRIDKRLKVIMLRYEGHKNKDIAVITGYNCKFLSELFSEFKKHGAEKYVESKYKGNHRSMSYDEEDEILNKFSEKAGKGQQITVKEIKAAFDEKIGHDTGSGYIYMVLKRHNWRKVMPRSKHPKKADEEEINSSKKLKLL